MNKINHRTGFTLLEILIVIIIIGVLASAALPQLFKNVEYARAVEAMVTLGFIKRSIEGCAMQFNNNYTTCTSFDSIGFQDPSYNPTNNMGSHFSYAISTAATTYQVVATRNSTDNGFPGDIITISRSDNGTITRSGTTAFSGIK